jgi:hypothetical protein
LSGILSELPQPSVFRDGGDTSQVSTREQTSTQLLSVSVSGIRSHPNIKVQVIKIRGVVPRERIKHRGRVLNMGEPFHTIKKINENGGIKRGDLIKNEGSSPLKIGLF